MIDPEPKTKLVVYWEQRELYMKNAMAYEAMQVFRYYGRDTHKNQIDPDEQRRALKLAMDQRDGFESEGVLSKHVSVPFASTESKVSDALMFLDRKLDEYVTKNDSGVKYRIQTYRDSLELYTSVDVE